MNFEGKASGSFFNSTGYYGSSQSFQVRAMDSVALDPDAQRYGFDPTRDIPPFLAELMKHPERVSMSESVFEHGGPWSSPLTITIAAPAPVPEPAALAVVMLALGGGWMVRRGRRHR